MRVVFVGKHRAVWKRLVWYVLTLGISRRIWLYRIGKEVDGHEALGLDHRLHAVLLMLPIVGPTIVTARIARVSRAMLAGSGIPYGPWPAVYLPTWVPILGNIWFIAWQQSRLNRFWAEERRHPEHGVDIDIDIAKDPRFIVEMQRALKDSYEAGSRFDRNKVRRQERLRAWQQGWHSVREERAAVRAAGGSTPVLPWRRPRREAPRRLTITCGRCDHRFEVTQDPYAETVLHCPSCSLHEVLPALHDDPLATPDQAAYPAVEATCPECGRTFHAARRLDGPTDLTCPQCGHRDSLPAPTSRSGGGPAARAPRRG